MPAINQLSAVDTVRSSDQVPIYSSENGDARKASMSVIQEFMLDNFVGSLDQSAQALADDDLFAIYDESQDKSVSISALFVLAYMQANLTFPGFTTQYATPSATGFNVQITNSSANTWLILTPTAGYAAGTITLPAIANVVDKQEVLINCTQQVNALTVNGNGAIAVTGEPTVLAADDFFKLRFDEQTSSWYRVG